MTETPTRIKQITANISKLNKNLSKPEKLSLFLDVRAAIEMIKEHTGIDSMDAKTHGVDPIIMELYLLSHPVLKKGFAARQTLVEQNLAFVLQQVTKHCRVVSYIDIADAYYYAIPGLYRAVEKFEPAQGYQFSTYAAHWIHQKFFHLVKKESSSMNIPIDLLLLRPKVTRFVDKFLADNGREPTYTEITKALDGVPSQVQDAMSIPLEVSLTERVGKSDDAHELLETLVPSSEGELTRAEHYQEFLSQDNLKPQNTLLAELFSSTLSRIKRGEPLTEDDIARINAL